MTRVDRVEAFCPGAATAAVSKAAMWLLAAALALVGGCAKPGPPGGGPVDEQPPTVVRTLPEDGALDVAGSSLIEIEFSEEMNRQAAERSLGIVPGVELRNFRWKGRTLVVEPAESLPDSTTMIIEIGASARDYHEVAIGRPFSFAFSTGDALDTGTIEGSVTAGGDAVKNAIVWACQGPAAPDSSGALQSCGYASSTGEDGRFRMVNVKASAAPYTLIGFVDQDGDGRYMRDKETGAVLEDAALVAARGDSVGGLIVPVEPPAAGE